MTAAWDIAPIKKGAACLVRVGDAVVWVVHDEKTVRIAQDKNDRGGDRNVADGTHLVEPVSEIPDTLDWQHWVTPAAGKENLCIRPLMPDRPIVFRPREPIRVPAGGRLQCFIEVPVWIGVYFAGTPQTLLFAAASQTLSNTWFGSPTEGEFAYAIKAEMNREEALTSGRHDAIVCPVRIRNRANNPLDCSRLCLRTQFLSIYRGTRMLWSNESSLSYHGEEEWSKIAYANSAPAYDGAGARLSAPREQSKSRFALRSFTSGVDLS